ncbi:hypothetical protein J2S43_007044 [Catenuloplanes nepalensis]|uniref:Uncharacterized protein n=1 Tax=Catenuloplanes nepalensis TaxID=587533 RepID=A0ABT9N4D0_9ACTN|nr:hypothetical protein [Catenuloplanes nepalensis]MDP9798532.1 hypothetical protein [Catenuloplanes nepalensis]
MDYDDRDLSGRAPRQRRRADSWSEDDDYGDELPRPRAAEESQVERFTSYPDPATTDYYRRAGDTGVGDIPPVRSSRARNRWQASRETEGWRQEPDGAAAYGRTSESVSYEDAAPERPSWADRRYDTGSWRNVSDTASWRRGSRAEPDEDTGYRAYQPGGRYGSRTDPIEAEPAPRRRPPPDEDGGSWGRDAEEDTWNRRSGAGSWRRVTETRTWVSETGSWNTTDAIERRASDVPAQRPAPADDAGTWGGRAVREDTGTWDAPRPTRSERRRAERAGEQPEPGPARAASGWEQPEPAPEQAERPARGAEQAAEKPRHYQRSDWPDWGDPTMGPARTRGMRADAGSPVPRSGNAPQLPPEAVQERPDRAQTSSQWTAGAPGTTDTGTWRRRPENANDGDWRGPQAVSDTGTWRRGAQMDDGPRARRDRSATEDTGTRAGGYGFTRAEPDAPRPRYAGETGEVSRYPRRTETDTSSWQRTPEGVMWTGAPATGAAPSAGVYRASRPVRSWQDDTSAAERDWAAGQANTGTYPDGLARPSYPDAAPEQRTPRREMSAAMRRQLAVEELDELEEAPPGGPLAAIGFTVFWYSVPVLLFTVFTLTQGEAERARAGATLLGAAPQFGISLAVSIVIAYLLRLVSGTWKTASVGLAAAVMGGGLATVLVSAISGQPIG